MRSLRGGPVTCEHLLALLQKTRSLQVAMTGAGGAGWRVVLQLLRWFCSCSVRYALSPKSHAICQIASSYLLAPLQLTPASSTLILEILKLLLPCSLTLMTLGALPGAPAASSSVASLSFFVSCFSPFCSLSPSLARRKSRTSMSAPALPTPEELRVRVPVHAAF